MQDRSCTVAKQNQTKSGYSSSATAGGGNMKKGAGNSLTSQADRTKANATSGGSWGPHFKSREHFNSMHFC